MACKQCGLCCISADIRFEDLTKTNKVAVMERARWLNLHRCDTQLVTREDKSQSIMLRIPLTCIKLDQHKNGDYFCKDYENRPELCRTFLCKRAKEK